MATIHFRATENTMFPGRDNYIGPSTGWFGFLHHQVLYEYSHDVNERVAFVKRRKPDGEVPVRLHHMIYLGDYDAKRAALDADYDAKCAALDADYYDAKCAALDADILAYIKLHIPDCAWNGERLVFE